VQEVLGRVEKAPQVVDPRPATREAWNGLGIGFPPDYGYPS
jgi:hypothetical protein